MPCVFVDVTWIHLGGKLCSYVHCGDHYSKSLLHPCLMCLWMWLGFTQRVSCAHMYTLVIITWTPYCTHALCVCGCDLDSLRRYVVLICTLWWSLPKFLVTPMPYVFVDVTWIHSGCKLCSYVHSCDHYPNSYYTHAVCDLTWIHSGCKLCLYVHSGDHYPNSLWHPCLICLWMWLGFTQLVSCANMYTLVIITRNPCSLCVCVCDLDSLSGYVVLICTLWLWLV